MLVGMDHGGMLVRHLILLVLILEGSEIGLGFLVLGFRDFDSREKPQFMRFFRDSSISAACLEEVEAWGFFGYGR